MISGSNCTVFSAIAWPLAPTAGWGTECRAQLLSILKKERIHDCILVGRKGSLH